MVSDFDEPGDDDVMRKVVGDLQGKGVDTDDATVRKQMDILLEKAKQQLADEV